MDKQQKIIIAVILIVAAIYLLPNLKLFSVLGPNEYNSNSAKTFLTNVNYGTDGEQFNDYGTSDSWVSVDWDSDGTLEGYGFSGIYSSQDEFCSSKRLITSTPENLRVVELQNTPYNELAICDIAGLHAYKFRSDTYPASEAIINPEEGVCVNCNENITLGRVCAMDIKICSDGSTVSRDPNNNCNFLACPRNQEPPIIINESCTADVYITCSNGVRYKSKNCINGTLTDVMYFANPCGTTTNQTNTTISLQALCISTNGTWTNSCQCPTNKTFSSSLGCQQITEESSIKWWMIIGAIALLIIVLLLNRR